MRSGRIYPVPVKPASKIGRWGDWPEDVEPMLRTWNRGWGLRGEAKATRRHQLTFRRSLSGSIFEPSLSVFKCNDCNEFCEPHRYGAAVLDGNWLCDDCLIRRARGANPNRSGGPT